MRRVEEIHLSKRIGMTRRKERRIKGINDPSHLSSKIDLNHINKGSHIKVIIK
jgi:hypothetical protein